MLRDGSWIEPVSAEKTGWETYSPRWSPDGQRILYVAHSEDKNEFHLVSSVGEKLMRVAVPSQLTSVGSVSWTPDGTEIAFAGQAEEPDGSYNIYSMNLDEDEQPSRIVVDGIQPAWSPDGKYLAFTTLRDGNLEVYVADGEGEGQRNLTRHEGYDGRPSWSPDGNRITFESDRFGNLEICIMDVASGAVVNVTNHPAKDREPAWSADGRELAFVSNRDLNNHIYRMAVDGSGVTRLTSGNVEDREPSWSPDGESLCFNSNRSQPFLDGLRRWFGTWLTDWPKK